MTKSGREGRIRTRFPKEFIPRLRVWDVGTLKTARPAAIVILLAHFARLSLTGSTLESIFSRGTLYAVYTTSYFRSAIHFLSIQRTRRGFLSSFQNPDGVPVLTPSCMIASEHAYLSYS